MLYIVTLDVGGLAHGTSGVVIAKGYRVSPTQGFPNGLAPTGGLLQDWCRDVATNGGKMVSLSFADPMTAVALVDVLIKIKQSTAGGIDPARSRSRPRLDLFARHPARAAWRAGL
jgi:hypothetical protein